MAAGSIKVEGLKELRKELKGVSPKLAKALQVANKTVSDKFVEEAKPAVRKLPAPGGSRAIKGIKSRATQAAANVIFSKDPKFAPLMATIMGGNWYPVFGRLVRVSKMRRRLWQKHVGNTWKPEELYGVGPIFKRTFEDFALEEYEQALAKAFEEVK